MNPPDLGRQRKIAKNGMILSLGVTALTGLMMKGKAARYLHYTAGTALVGLSIWHHQLYTPQRKSSEKKLPMPTVRSVE